MKLVIRKVRKIGGNVVRPKSFVASHPRWWGDPKTTGNQERASERRKRKRVESRKRAGNYPKEK